MVENEFKVLRALVEEDGLSQRALAEKAGLSLGTVNAVLKALREKGWVGDAERGRGVGVCATSAGRDALAPYKVRNAVIMAAGLSSRFAPISYERPKGVLRVRGEVLVERQIRQLKEAGIHDITVVVGYMKEQFFYLEDAFGVRIVVNEEYAVRNNNSTIRKVAGLLGNTYICSSDDYFAENPFERYVFRAYYAAVYQSGPTDEYCLVTQGREALITGVEIGGADSWIMLGHAYWDAAFSAAFLCILDEIYDQPETAGKLWEDIYLDHIAELPMVMRRYPAGVIWEFDSVAELNDFDPDFMDNVDSRIMDNICAVLGCTRADITHITPLKQGLTNLSFRFEAAGGAYVYRHPGTGTEAIINRESEAFSQGVAKRLGIDGTFLFEDPQEGWKLSRFVPGCVPFDYHDDAQVERGLALVRQLHGCGEVSPWSFDVYRKACDIVELLKDTSFPDFEALRGQAAAIAGLVAAEGGEPCLCHGNFYDMNFLVAGDEMHLIDWEYSAMSDYASDLGTFICCSDYTEDEAVRVIERYFGRTPTAAELRHCMAYVALASYYWFAWALYQDQTGSPVGEWLYRWYRDAKSYGKRALELYEAAVN